MRIAVDVNDTRHEADVEPRTLLSDFLRHDLGLTGTHVGCEHGVCGACTVLLDGVSVRGCCVLAIQADGSRVETVESLAESGPLTELQESFRRHHALQCGFCTPGMMLTSVAFLKDNPSPTDEEIRWALSGQICRCTGYQNIVNAVQAAAKTMREA